MKDDAFQLQIEQHPDTHLLQTVRLGPQRSVQVLELFDKYYLLDRYKGERRPPIQLDEAELVSRLVQGGRLNADEVEPLLPPLRGIDVVLDEQSESLGLRPTKESIKDSLKDSLKDAFKAPFKESSPDVGKMMDLGKLTGREPLAETPTLDPLQSKLQSAMARFAAQNPETAEALQWPQRQSSAPAQAESAYGAHPALSGGSVGLPAAPAPRETPPAASRASEAAPIETWTQPLVQQALQQASDNQQRLLEQAHQLKQDVDRRSGRVQKSLESLPMFQEKLDALNQQLEQWQSEMEKHHFSRDSLLERTDEELARLQHQLSQILSEGLALQKVLREHRFPEQSQMADKLDCFEDMLDHVVQQRHWVHYLQQQQAFRTLARERLKLLQVRRGELHDQIGKLKESIQDLEQINREILSQDPLAVPEPVPALALHELSRLEYELQVLEADPALQLLEDNP